LLTVVRGSVALGVRGIASLPPYFVRVMSVVLRYSS
jgi:hypothetical protein